MRIPRQQQKTRKRGKSRSRPRLAQGLSHEVMWPARRKNQLCRFDDGLRQRPTSLILITIVRVKNAEAIKDNTIAVSVLSKESGNATKPITKMQSHHKYIAEPKILKRRQNRTEPHTRYSLLCLTEPHYSLKVGHLSATSKVSWPLSLS